MSKRTFEDYIENECHPTGYNEPCQSYVFGQSTVDMLLDKLAEKNSAIRSQVCDEIYSEFEKRLMHRMLDMPVINMAHLINSVLDSVRNKKE